jgi:anti-sigma regulatory factor (Ser/Thr protein kinase)
MARECSRTTIELSRDERLVPGIGGAVAHYADRVGLTEAVRDSLVAALEEFCRQSLPLLGSNSGRLTVAIEEFEDRIEIVVEHQGLARPSAGMETFLAANGGQSDSRLLGVRLLRTVDRVEYEARNGLVSTTLVKYLHSRCGAS